MNIEMVRGDSLPVTATVFLDEVPFDLTGSTLTFTAKRKVADPDSAAVFQKSTTAESIVLVDADAGEISFEIEPDDTAAEAANVLVWDLRLRTTANKIYTLNSGLIRLSGQVTITP